eukprot:GHVR01050423.1.p2 GENE.GHVR01050423.1~~GHVR01050423.1.p2  ORF type:complete len:102 (-),score=5.65 GHVR01050423.1:49-354(-)
MPSTSSGYHIVAPAFPVAQPRGECLLPAPTKCDLLHNLDIVLLLPLVQFLLLGQELALELCADLLQTLGVSLQRRKDVLHCHLDKYSIDHAEAFAVSLKGL